MRIKKYFIRGLGLYIPLLVWFDHLGNNFLSLYTVSIMQDSEHRFWIQAPLEQRSPSPQGTA